MERLTVRRKDGRWAIANNDGASPVAQMEKIPLAIDRLAAYEDTGLEPEDIEGLLERGTPLERGTAELMKAYLSIGSVEHLRELAQAEKDGRLVKYLPGDTVYDRFGREWTVTSSEIHVLEDGLLKHLYRCSHSGTDDYCALYADEILTRTEAEAALEMREEERNG